MRRTFERYRLLLAKLESRIDLGLGAARFPDHDGCVRVVLLHGGIRLCEEAPEIRSACMPLPPFGLHGGAAAAAL